VDTALDSATGLMKSSQALLNHNTFEIDHSIRQLNQVTSHLDETIETIQADPSVVVWGSQINKREKAK